MRPYISESVADEIRDRRILKEIDAMISKQNPTVAYPKESK